MILFKLIALTNCGFEYLDLLEANVNTSLLLGTFLSCNHLEFMYFDYIILNEYINLILS